MDSEESGCRRLIYLYFCYDLQQNLELLNHTEILNQVAGDFCWLTVVSMDDARVIIRWARTDYTDDVEQ
jgi:hypothetical protein